MKKVYKVLRGVMALILIGIGMAGTYLKVFLPDVGQPRPKPAENDRVAYGAYIINASGCVDCHSKVDEKGVLIKGSEFGGGRKFGQPAGIIRSPNITFDRESGIGHWTKEMFVQLFKAYADSSYASPKLTPADLNSPMPWLMYSGMKNEDLEAIYAYLQSLKPIHNQVSRAEKAR